MTIGALLLCLGCTSLVSAQRVEREVVVNAVKIKLSTDRPIVPINDPVIVVGVYRDKQLRYAARVRAGFVPLTRRQVFERIKSLKP
jgi:hypothetical protein